MKKTVSALLCALLLCLLCVPAAASQPVGVTYYIDSISGSDAGDGLSPETAWKTVPVKDAVLEKGDRVLFRRGGQYACTLTLHDCAGTPERPIIVTAYGEGDKPLLTTDENTEVLRLFDCSYLTVSELEITAHNGGGVWIDAYHGDSVGVTLENLTIHDIQNHKMTCRDGFHAGAATARACVMVKGLIARSRFLVHDLTIRGCEMYNCGNGVLDWGAWDDDEHPWDGDPAKVKKLYNRNHRIENCYMHDMDAEGLVFGICQNCVMTHCRLIDCCQGEGVDENGEILYFTAAAWFWGADHCTIEWCEIAGQKNVGDGMTVDFDSQSNYCTYQYIYSHDNVRFMCNNAKTEPQVGNVVRYCLSVNDNGGRNLIAASAGEKGMRFYNNTIIGSQSFLLGDLYDSYFVNNLIVMEDGYPMVPYRDAYTKNGNVFACNAYDNFWRRPMTGAKFVETPGFVGTDPTDRYAFRLSASSPLIGAGYAIETNDDAVDFFGNPVTQNNIGCYGGNGEATAFRRDSILRRFAKQLTAVFRVLRRELPIYLQEVLP